MAHFANNTSSNSLWVAVMKKILLNETSGHEDKSAVESFAVLHIIFYILMYRVHNCVVEDQI